MSIQIAVLSVFLTLSSVLLVYTIDELKEVLKDEDNIRECSRPDNNTRCN
jgi:hypothetical protein